MRFGVLAFLGLLLMAVGFTQHALLTPARGDVVVEGTVVDVVLTQSTEGDTLYARKFEFTDPGSGKNYLTTERWRTGQPAIPGGTERVAFPSGSPQKGRVIGSQQRATVFLGMIGVGAALTLGGVTSLYKARQTAS